MRALFLGACREETPDGVVIRLCFANGIPMVLWVVAGAAMAALVGREATSIWLTGLAGVIAIGLLAMLYAVLASRVRLEVHRKRGTLSIRSRDVNTEIPLRDIARVVAWQRGGVTRGPLFQLAIVLRDGRTVEATRGYHGYSEANCNRVVDAVRGEIAAISPTRA